jgi:hypothetical protein
VRSLWKRWRLRDAEDRLWLLTNCIERKYPKMRAKPEHTRAHKETVQDATMNACMKELGFA